MENLRSVLRKARDSVRGESRVSRAQYDSYFKFAFVRNSWARAYSWYKNVVRDEIHRRNLGVPEDCTLPDFVRDHVHRQWSIRPQLFWLRDHRERIPMDFIGRFERLQEDFAHVCEVLELEDTSLPKLVTGDGSSYVDKFDDASRKRIATLYRDEIELFGFRFGE